jgi:ketosteroid isomerase-like protein
MTAASRTTDELVRELHDRALIGELLLRFARALDERDWEGYAALYADDGVLQLPWGPPRPREGLAQDTEANLGRFHATQHISSNHQIAVEGDEATSRSYLQAVHVSDPEATDGHWTLGGWYDCSYRRTPDGWRFTRVAITPVWQTGRPPDWAGA